MPKVDDYLQALRLGREGLKESNPDLLAGFADIRIEREENGKAFFLIPFLGDRVKVEWPEFNFLSADTNQELPAQQQILLLHYSAGSLGVER